MPSEAISDLFVFCEKERETIDHLFLHCEFSHFLCCQMLDRSGVLWCSSQSISSTIEAWGLSPFSGCGLILWRLIPFAIFWSFWKERNARVSNGSSMPKEDKLSLVLMRIAKWVSVRKELDSSWGRGHLSQLGSIPLLQKVEGETRRRFEVQC